MVRLNDGSFLMAREKDILEFFNQNQIVGRTITGVFPKEMNYGISNWDDLLEEIDDISAYTNECAIQTDDFVFLELDHGKWLAIQFSGSGGPVIMEMISGNDLYPKIPEDLFSLNTLFRDCRGKKITDLQFLDNGYQAADALAMLFEHGGNPNLFCESGCLFDDVDFSVTFDAVEQQDRQRYSSLVHCWMVCFAFGGTLKNGNAPIKVSRNFDVEELKDHRRFYFGITKGERWPDIHIFDKRDMWEVVRI